MRDLGLEWAAAQAAGDFAEAWRISDRVLAARDSATRDDPGLPYHLRWVWDGTPPHGRDVLVRCYHGLGDTLQFARFLPALAARAATLRVEAQPELLPLLRQLPGVDRFLAFNPARPAPPAPCTLEIMELAHALRLRPDDVPVPYLHAPPETALGIPATPPGPDIGVCARAGGWDPARSVPPEILADALAGRRWLDLAPAQIPATMAGTARRLARLRLVITVDTAVAHLAGAMGRPGIVLLKHAPDWRWRDGGERSVWYPSLRLLRQPAPGDWRSVARELRAALEAELPAAYPPPLRPEAATRSGTLRKPG